MSVSRTPIKPATFDPVKTPASEKKRKPSDSRSIDDIYDLLVQQTSDMRHIKSNLASIKTENAEIAEKLQDEIKLQGEAMNNKIAELKTCVHQEVKVIEHKVDVVKEIASSNQREINILYQTNLNCVMEISGLPLSCFNENTNATQLAINTIKSFDIVINCSDIITARILKIQRTSRDVKVDAPILIVTFACFEKKVAVMKAKRLSGPHRNIFFNHSLTQLNRKMYMKARRVALDRNLKYFFAANKVQILRPDGTTKWIYEESDLEEFERLPLSKKKQEDNIKAKIPIQSISADVQVQDSAATVEQEDPKMDVEQTPACQTLIVAK
jgi:hypothetical protein